MIKGGLFTTKNRLSCTQNSVSDPDTQNLHNQQAQMSKLDQIHGYDSGQGSEEETQVLELSKEQWPDDQPYWAEEDEFNDNIIDNIVSQSRIRVGSTGETDCDQDNSPSQLMSQKIQRPAYQLQFTEQQPRFRKKISDKAYERPRTREDFQPKSQIKLSKGTEAQICQENLKINLKVSELQKQNATELSHLDKERLEERLLHALTNQEILLVKRSVEKVARNLQENRNTNNATDRLLQWIKGLKAGFLVTSPYTVLTVYLTKFYGNQSPFMKKYITKVLINLMKMSQSCPNNLIGIQKVVWNSHTKSSKLAELLQKQQPRRTVNFQQSSQSKIYKKTHSFIDPKATQRQIQKELIDIQDYPSVYGLPIPEKLELIRLTCSQPCKTVTIITNGFLTEDKSSDISWIEIIRALGDSEVFELKWKSSTKQEMFDFARKSGKGLLQEFFNPLGLMTGLAGLAFNAVRILTGFNEVRRDNPFTQAKKRAQSTGKYLAEILIKAFEGRFINLVGFSLGTEVLTQCLRHFTDKGKSHMINRVVTFGGVAQRQDVQEVLKRAHYPWTWYNLRCQRDSVVKYIYRAVYTKGSPIGLNGIPRVDGHEIVDIEASSFVKGHMDYKHHHYPIALMTGLKTD